MEKEIKIAIQKLNPSIKIGWWLAPFILILTDYCAIVLALISTHYIINRLLSGLFPFLTLFNITNHYLYLIIPVFYLGLLFYERLYSKRLPFWQCARKLFKISFYATVFSVSIFYFIDIQGIISRFALNLLLVFIYLTITRYIIKHFLIISGLWQKPVVLVGSSKIVDYLTKALEEEFVMGYRVSCIIKGQEESIQENQMFEKFINLEETIQNSGIHEVVIVAPEIPQETFLELVYRIQPLVKNITIVPNLIGIPMSNVEANSLFNYKVVLLRVKNNLAHSYNRIIKRCFDLVCSIIVLIVVAPLMLLIAILIYIDSPGPVVFAHFRIGARGKKFPCLKFRTMMTNAKEIFAEYLAQNPEAYYEWQKIFKLRNDPRITRIGKWLRKTSLDELPQIFNVLRGEMSLVGPRPIVKEEIERYEEYIDDYYMVHPGITGLWQTSGRSDVDYKTRVQMDSWYIRNWSLWLDVCLLFETVKVVFGRKGAY